MEYGANAALASAATDETVEAFQATLERMQAATKDGQGAVFGTGTAYKRPLPELARFIGEALVVTDAGEATGLLPGDTITSIDSVTIEAKSRELTPRISAATLQYMRVVLAHRLLTISNTQFAMVEVARSKASETKLLTLRDQPLDTNEVPEPKRLVNGSELAPGILYLNLVGMGVQE